MNYNNGFISNNFAGGTVIFNNGMVAQNNGEVVSNFSVVHLADEAATVGENHGAVVKGECNTNGVTTYKEDSISYSVTYIDGASELGHYNYNEAYVDQEPWPVAPVAVVESETFGISKFGHTEKWTVYYDNGTSYDYYPGDIYNLVGYVNLNLGWDKTINADICFEDENGVYEGRSFLLNQPIENFQNVSCNAAYLEKGVDYTVEAEDGMTRVNLTDKFFEKNGDGPVAVAPLFVGAIYYLYAVKG